MAYLPVHFLFLFTGACSIWETSSYVSYTDQGILYEGLVAIYIM